MGIGPKSISSEPVPELLLELLIQNMLFSLVFLRRTECEPGAADSHLTTIIGERGVSSWPKTYVRSLRPDHGYYKDFMSAQAATTEYYQQGCLNNTFISHSSGGWEVQDQGAHQNLLLVRVCFLACRQRPCPCVLTGPFCVCALIKGEFWCLSLSQGHESHHGPPPQ